MLECRAKSRVPDLLPSCRALSAVSFDDLVQYFVLLEQLVQLRKAGNYYIPMFGVLVERTYFIPEQRVKCFGHLFTHIIVNSNFSVYILSITAVSALLFDAMQTVSQEIIYDCLYQCGLSGQ